MATIGQLMTRDLSVIQQGASIQQAAQSMLPKRIRLLLVKIGDDFLGIVTESDVVQAVAEQPEAVARLRVQEVMSSSIITVSPHDARDLMADRKIRHLGVTEKDKIVGGGFSSGSLGLF